MGFSIFFFVERQETWSGVAVWHLGQSDFYSTCKTIMKDFLRGQDQITEGFGEGQCVLGCLPEVSLSAWHKPVSLGNFFSFSFAVEMHN